MKKIDAHSHIGKFGGWAGVDFNKQRLVEQMEEYEIEKTFLTASSFQGNDACLPPKIHTARMMNASPKCA